MTSYSLQRSSLRRNVLLAVATLAAVCGASSAMTGAASAATPECQAVAEANGGSCISVFSSALDNYPHPDFVEAVLGGGDAVVGQPVGLKAASRFDSSEDIFPVGGKVSDFYAAHIVSAAANSHYGALDAVQQKYAPFGVPTNLCVGLARVAYQDEPLELQPCTASTTVWVLMPPNGQGFFPIINASTPDFKNPFAMHLPRNEVVNGRPLAMHARRLTYLGKNKTLPAKQLWGAYFGVI